MRIGCKVVRELLSDYIDGELAKEEMAAVSAHLLRCPRCRREADELKAVVELLKKQPVPMPDGLYFERLGRSISREAVDGATWLKLRLKGLMRARPWLRKAVWHAAVVSLAALAAILIDRAFLIESLDEAILKSIKESIGAGEQLTVARFVDRSARPFVAIYKAESPVEGEEGWGIRIGDLRLKLNSVKVEDRAIKFVGNLDLSELKLGGDLADLLSSEEMLPPKVSGVKLPNLSPSRVSISSAPKSPKVKGGSRLREMIYYTDIAFVPLTADD